MYNWPMPIYEYRCRSCGHRFEAIRPMGDDGSGLDCPGCGVRGPELVPSVFATVSGTSDASPCASCEPSGFG